MDQLGQMVTERRAAEPDETEEQARDAVAAVFGAPSWQRLAYEHQRRTVLNACDVERAEQLLADLMGEYIAGRETGAIVLLARALEFGTRIRTNLEDLIVLWEGSRLA